MSLQNVCALLGAGGSGRIRENRNGILPDATASGISQLRHQRENGENSSLSLHAQARTRARNVHPDRKDSLFSPILPGPVAVTLLKLCQCIDCRKFHRDGLGNFYCDSYIGGMQVIWATGRRSCNPLPDAWHYCAEYHGPQISRDVWAWPALKEGQAVEVGPSGPAAAEYRGGNGTAAGLFRSLAHTQGKEA